MPPSETYHESIFLYKKSTVLYEKKVRLTSRENLLSWVGNQTEISDGPVSSTFYFFNKYDGIVKYLVDPVNSTLDDPLPCRRKDLE